VSPLARPSIAARVLASLLIVSGIATAPRAAPGSLAASAVLVVLLLLVIRPDARTLGRRAAAALLGVIAVALPIALVDPARASLLAGRALCAALAALAIASTIPAAELGPALSGLGVPRGVSTVIASMLRQAGSIATEGRRLALARSLRGATGLGASTEMFAALLARSSLRAERVELALRLRGHDESARPAGARLGLGDVPAVAAAAVAALGVHLSARL
jgi:energy-coupling factor transporter transmembrane protein EcfT